MYNNKSDVCISFENVSKTYKIYPSVKSQMLDALGFYKLRGIPTKPYSEFHALKEINLQVRKGRSLGIIGRNGAGKSTLLKLLTGNFYPSRGKVNICGNVQALMSTGLGFHPDLTGKENIKNALLYTNINNVKDVKDAYNDIIDFCELDEFIDQPIKTYSLGMLSRLQFACATAIKPEILIVDEILGAGDAYFSGKCAYRMRKIIKENSCTLLLVSHSTQQILQFCDEAIWIEQGQIARQGEVLQVIKDYEKFIDEKGRKQTIDANSNHNTENCEYPCVPTIATEQQNNFIKSILEENNFVSRWATIAGLKIKEVLFLGDKGKLKDNFRTGESLSIRLKFYAEHDDLYHFKAVIVIFTEEGLWLARHISDTKVITLKKNQQAEINLEIDEVLYGNGTFILSVALYKNLDLDHMYDAEAYDLLSRSFKIKVVANRDDDSTIFYHPAKWSEVKALSNDKLPNDKLSFV